VLQGPHRGNGTTLSHTARINIQEWVMNDTATMVMSPQGGPHVHQDRRRPPCVQRILDGMCSTVAHLDRWQVQSSRPCHCRAQSVTPIVTMDDGVRTHHTRTACGFACEEILSKLQPPQFRLPLRQPECLERNHAVNGSFSLRQWQSQREVLALSQNAELTACLHCSFQALHLVVQSADVHVQLNTRSSHTAPTKR
jgi:hypothetical protein